MKNMTLKSEIYKKFETMTDFCRVLGIRETKLSHFVHGRLEPTAAEKEAISSKLGVPQEKIFSKD